MNKYKPLLWCTLAVRGEPVPVWLSCAKLSECLTNSAGVTTLGADGRLTIWIDVEGNRDTQDETLAHEFVHACLWGSKVLHSSTEEKIARIIAGRGSQVFIWPRRPAGTLALEHYARKA